MHMTKGGGTDPLAQIVKLLTGNGTTTGSSVSHVSTGSSN